MKIVAFGHRRFTGKDTICRFIQREILLKSKGLKVNLVGFADQLKNTLYQLYGWIGVKPMHYYEEHLEEKDKPIIGLRAVTGCESYRDLCINFGQYCRKFDDSIWLNALLKTTNCDILLIKDMRFEPEFNKVKDHNGICNKIVRPGNPEFNDEADSGLAHLSDDVWDNVYVNGGTLQDLHKIASVIVNQLLEIK